MPLSLTRLASHLESQIKLAGDLAPSCSEDKKTAKAMKKAAKAEKKAEKAISKAQMKRLKVDDPQAHAAIKSEKKAHKAAKKAGKAEMKAKEASEKLNQIKTARK